MLNSKVNDILKLKKDYPNLLAKKIENIHKIINNSGKPKLKIYITTKGLLRKQIIILMSNENKSKFIASSSKHIVNINRSLKNIKLDVMADYICLEQKCITIVTNKVALSLDLQVIENYVKNVNSINSKDIDIPCLSQSKSYLKIIGIPYFIENTNIPITLDFVKTIIKFNHIFNNIVLLLKSYIIKVLSKSNMTIV